MKDLKIFTDNIEESAKEQIELLLEQDAFKDCKVRIMPDVHAGKGCVIGFTGNLGEKVIPNIVGVDIGCGMLCVELGDISIDLEQLDKVIRDNIPCGREVHDKVEKPIKLTSLKCYNELKDMERINNSLGTLGGGNHFIEVDEDENKNKYLVIHTGSRNLGKQVAEIYQNKAIEYCSYDKEMKEEKENLIKEYKEQGKEKDIQVALEEITKKYSGKTKLPKELCYLENDLRKDYLNDMIICQFYAKANRERIANIILENCKGDILLEHNDIRNIKVNNEKINRQGEIVKRARKVYKKVLNPKWGGPFGIGKRELIVTLELIPGSIVFCINGKKCRTNKARVVAIDGKKEKGTKAISGQDRNFVYEVGKVVEVEDFDLRYNIECSSGIHFFNTKKEAEDYLI